MPFATTAHNTETAWEWAVDESAAKAIIRLGLHIHDKYGDQCDVAAVGVYYSEGEYIAEAGVGRA